MAADRAQQLLGHFDSKKGILNGYVSIITGSGNDSRDSDRVC